MNEHIMTKVLLFAILLFVVGLNYICVVVFKSNPDIISGFKMSDEPEQRALDEVWLNKMSRYLTIANIVTLTGGLIGIIFDLQILYYVSLVLPLILALLFGYIQRKGAKGEKKKNVAVIATLIFTILLISLPVFYTFNSDLEVTLTDKEMTIGGLYGLDIPLQEIKEKSLCQSLPAISTKTNGFALAKTRLGHFRTATGEDIMLFTHSDSCFLRITRTNGVTYYLSSKDKKATGQLLTKLQKKQNCKTK